MKDGKRRESSPCSLSAECLRLIDEIDPQGVARPTGALAAVDDLRDEELIERLRPHIPTCPSCEEAVAQASQLRYQQRSALQSLLADGERLVPSTTMRILTVIRQEGQKTQIDGTNANANHAGPKGTPDILMPLRPLRPSRRRRGQQISFFSPYAPNTLRNVLAVAVVALIVLSTVILFNQRIFHSLSAKIPLSAVETPALQHGTPSSTATTPGIQTFDGWNYAMIVVPSSRTGSFTVNNFNPASGTLSPLSALRLPANTDFDTIAPDGLSLLYQNTSADKTNYCIVSSRLHSGCFYSISGNGGNAIWKDGSNILLSTFHSIVEVNLLTGSSSTLFPALQVARLTFYHQPFLYFVGASDRSIDELYRINVVDGAVQQLTTFRSTSASYWLSPNGQIIYFANRIGPGGEAGIYAVNSDGSDLILLRAYPDGIPIGYAADNSLLIMRVMNVNFEVVKIGATEQQDQVVYKNAAPGADSLCAGNVLFVGSICDSNIAMAPYGHALIVQGSYRNGTNEVWSDDLVTSKQAVRIQSLSGTNGIVQLPGWDRIQTP